MKLNQVQREGARWTIKLLLLGFATLVFALAFAALASEVIEGDTHALDTGVASMAYQLRSHLPWLLEAMRDLSGLGSTVTLVIAVTVAVGYMLLIGARSTAYAMAASAVSGIAATCAAGKACPAEGASPKRPLSGSSAAGRDRSGQILA